MRRVLADWTGILWLGIGLATLGLFVPSEVTAHDLLQHSCAGAQCFDHQLTPHVAALLRHAGFSLEFYAAYYTGLAAFFAAVWTALAVVLVARKPSDHMARFAGMAFVSFGCSLFGVMNAPAAASYGWAPAAQLLNNAGFLSLFILLYVFPDGRFVPSWTRWVALAEIASLIGTALLPHTAVDSDYWPGPLSLVPFTSLIFTSLFAQVYRFRRVSGPVERQQTKWVVLGSATALLGFFGLVILQTVVPALSDTGSPLAIFMIGVAVSLFLLIPVSVAIAILRYRLWEIDVLINRALVYGSLTVSTAAVYIGGVIGLQALFRSISGQSSDLAVAIVTLAVAALFNPWRRRLQRFIDRRFYRQRYDAARALTVMSSRLRDEVDLDSLIGEIVSVVDQTVQPSHLALWLPAESAR
jgi:hypothetical protein